LDPVLVHVEIYFFVQMHRQDHREYTIQKMNILFYKWISKIQTNKTFQSNKSNFRIGNGGDGALQNTQIAWYNVLANNSSLSFG
jgi:hypothetical protein